MAAVESTMINLVQWLRLAVEATGALVIAVGVIMPFPGFGRALALQRPEHYVEVRLALGVIWYSQLSLNWPRTSSRRRLDRVGTKSVSWSQLL